jgi:hypothetical protein
MTKSVFDPVRRAARISMLCLPALLLAACGGGGGGGDGGGSGGGSTVAGVVITADNAKPLAADAIAVASDAQDAQGAGAMVMGAQVQSGSGIGTMRLVDISRGLVKLRPSGTLATGVTAGESMACPAGGTLQISGDQTTMTYVASNCKMDSASSMNGSMTITLHSGNPDAVTYPYQIDMSFSAQDLTVTYGTDSSTINGDMRIKLTANSATSQEITLSGSMLSSSSAGRSGVMKNYSQTLSVNGSATSQTVSGTVETTNSRLGGTFSYTITTVSPVTFNSTGSLTGGVVKITGNGSSLLMTVTGTDSIKLEVDGNGDGTYETTVTTTRTELESLM